LGARAIYLTTNGVDYGYRIHGTPEWKSIGRNASSGCIRMINQDVIDLYNRLQGGEKVVVLTRDGQYPTRLSLPPPAPKKPTAPAAAAPVVQPVVLTPDMLPPLPPPITTVPEDLLPPPAATTGAAATGAAAGSGTAAGTGSATP
jgi:hypothetical protein